MDSLAIIILIDRILSDTVLCVGTPAFFAKALLKQKKRNQTKALRLEATVALCAPRPFSAQITAAVVGARTYFVPSRLRLLELNERKVIKSTVAKNRGNIEKVICFSMRSCSSRSYCFPSYIVAALYTCLSNSSYYGHVCFFLASAYHSAFAVLLEFFSFQFSHFLISRFRLSQLVSSLCFLAHKPS